MMRRAVVLSLLAVAAAHADVLSDAKAAEARCDPAAALKLYLQLSAAQPESAWVLQKVAQQYSDLVESQPNEDAKRSYAQEAVAYARRAEKLAPDNAVDVLSVAVAEGKLALYSDMKTKVGFGRQIHDETLRAIALDPKYAWAHDILGQWETSVAGVTHMERFFLNTLFGGFPNASYAGAISELKLATELEPEELTHWIELGFAYKAAGKPAEARAAFQHGLAMPATKVEHPIEQQRARTALAALTSH